MSNHSGAVIPASCENFGVVIERTLTMNTTSMYHAFAYAFSSYYVFDMRYPKHAKASWEFTQRYASNIFYFNFVGKTAHVFCVM